MIWVQSVLFFILGAAVTGFLVMLVFPLVWRRALFLANKAVRMEIPVSLNEVEVERDFLRAEHASTVARLEELLNRSESRYAQVLLNYSQMRERNFYLLPFEQMSRELSQLNQQLAKEIITLKEDINSANRLMRGQAILKEQLVKLETRHQKALLTIKELEQSVNTDVDDQKADIARFEVEITRLNEENRYIQKSYENALNVLREEVRIMAAMLVANVAISEGKDSPIFQLIEKSEDPDSLAYLIKENVTSISSKTA